MNTEKNVMPEKRERTPVYTIARGLAWVLFHTVFPVRYHHTEKMDLQVTAPEMVVQNIHQIISNMKQEVGGVDA